MVDSIHKDDVLRVITKMGSQWNLTLHRLDIVLPFHTVRIFHPTLSQFIILSDLSIRCSDPSWSWWSFYDHQDLGTSSSITRIGDSPPATGDAASRLIARQNYTCVVRLLTYVGDTWWAAAAKQKLAEALARAVDELQSRDARGVAERTEQPPPPLTPLSGDVSQNINVSQQGDGIESDWNFEYQDQDFWASIGLDFDLDVAGNVFSLGLIS